MLPTIIAFAFQSIGTTVWFWLTVLIGFIWLKRHFDINRGRNEPVLRPDEPGLPADELPALTMLVAGKDEEENIGRCISGLLTQDYPNLQIIIINDRSDDRTPEIIDEFAARDPRVTALHIKELGEGWFGKNHAMHAGVQQATGDWLCFSDADCAYDSPHLLAAAVRYAIREKTDLLSVLPRLEVGSFWEQVIQPVAGAIMVFWFPPQKVNSPKYPHAYANGAFMLVSREAYDRLGGHEPVKATLNEDMHFARRCKQFGMRLHVIRGANLYRVRMYVGFKQIWRGWSRIFYGCFGTFARLLVSVLIIGIVSLSPYLTCLLSPLAGADWAWMLGAGAFAAFCQQSILWRFYPLTGNAPGWALTYPIGAAICFGMALNAMRRLSGATTTTWRGTTYRGGAQTNSEN